MSKICGCETVILCSTVRNIPFGYEAVKLCSTAYPYQLAKVASVQNFAKYFAENSAAPFARSSHRGVN